MTDFMTESLDAVVKSILEDGVIDDAEVEQFRKRLYDDGVIDKEEAEAVFQINDAVKGKDNSANWKKLFADSISDYVLKDETTPGVIDDDEAAWLIEKLEGDGEIDPNEKYLLLVLKENAKEISPVLRSKMKEWGV